MRLSYLNLGDTVGYDEYNALVYMLQTRDYPISETIKLMPSGYTGKLGTYSLTYDKDYLAFRDDDLQILNNEGYFKVSCVSNLNATFTLIFQGNEYVSSSDGTIIVDLAGYANNLLISNSFTIKIHYNTPYIMNQMGDDNKISSTSELKEVISTLEPDEILTLTDNITHDLTAPIPINKKVVIKSDTSVTFTPATGIKSNIFTVDDNYSLTLENLIFDGINDTENGGVIYNKGITNLNNIRFSNCQATGYGGCIYNEYGEVHTENCTFTNCTAKDGAGIYNAGDTE